MQTKKEWFEYLLNVPDKQVNVERADTVGSKSGSMVLGYTLRTLKSQQIEWKDNDFDIIYTFDWEAVDNALKWAETSKGLTKEEFDRDFAKDYDYEWFPHNYVSAQLYTNYSGDHFDLRTKTLIKWHGAIGQILRGELSINEIKDMVSDFKQTFSKRYEDGRTEDGLKESETICQLMLEVTRATIFGVSRELWTKVSDDATDIIWFLLSEKSTHKFNYDRYAKARFIKFKPDINIKKVIVQGLAEKFSKYSFWYPESVLKLLDTDSVITLLNLIAEHDTGEITDINFKPIADWLYYDYHGKEKRANVYKLRVLENYLKDKSDKNMELVFNVSDNKKFKYIEVSCKLTPACEAFVNFCVTAENENDISYKEAVYLLMDYFKLRRDKFDRLNNEKEYLKTMDNAENSRKPEIIKYIEGKSVVDVGSGSGVLLDTIEKEHPEICSIFGTDISSNCLESLNKKKVEEKHRWNVIKHNFVASPFNVCVDNIVFSSILHEIYSYTKIDGKRFQIESVKRALKNAYDSLNPGGRIIIRDGVKTENGSDQNFISTKNFNVVKAFEKFLNDFKGNVDTSSRIFKGDKNIEGNYIIQAKDINLLREFACTYTWGQDSYTIEVQEQFGYLTLKEYIEELKSVGFKVKVAEEYLEEGYPEHLKSELEFIDADRNTMKFPNTNLIIVATK